MTLLVQEGAMTVGELAGRFDMSLAAVSKHIKVLEAAGLVSRRTEWREHVISARMEPLQVVDRWLSGLRSNWAMRLEILAKIMKENDNDD
ncbi:helix-turn-helix domain-containing protein [Jiella flava]